MRKIWYKRVIDWKRFNRQWREIRAKSQTFRDLERICRANRDEAMFPIIADCVEETGYPVFAQIWRDGLAFKNPNHRRRP